MYHYKECKHCQKELGTNPTCPICKLSAALKRRWQQPSKAQIAAAKASIGRPRNLLGLQSAGAKAKLSTYYKSELFRAHAKKNGKLIAAKRRAGIIPQSLIPTCNTKPELAVRGELDQLGIKHKAQYKFGPYTFDFYLPEFSILLEVQGEYWHSLPDNVIRDQQKYSFIANNYPELQVRYIMALDTIKKGMVSKILTELTGKSRTYIDLNLDELIFKPIDIATASDFITQRHYLPRLRNCTKLAYGIHSDNTLIATLTYSNPSYNTTGDRHNIRVRNVLELSRFVIDDNYRVRDLTSWAISKSVKALETDSPDTILLVSFADPRFGHHGDIYRSSNWTHDGQTKPSYYYLDPVGCIIHKKTIWDHASKLGHGESEYATLNGLAKIDSESKERYIYWLRQPTDQPQSEPVHSTLQKCPDCAEEFTVSKKALQKAIRKRGGYICHSCSMRRTWKAGTYNSK